MANISKPDANPIVALLLCLFVFNLGHIIPNGQTRKWIFTFVGIIIGYILCCIPGLIMFVLNAMEAYKTAQRLQAGESIGENEYSVPALYKVIRFLDKTATCSAAKD